LDKFLHTREKKNHKLKLADASYYVKEI